MLECEKIKFTIEEKKEIVSIAKKIVDFYGFLYSAKVPYNENTSWAATFHLDKLGNNKIPKWFEVNNSDKNVWLVCYNINILYNDWSTRQKIKNRWVQTKEDREAFRTRLVHTKDVVSQLEKEVEAATPTE